MLLHLKDSPPWKSAICLLMISFQNYVISAKLTPNDTISVPFIENDENGINNNKACFISEKMKIVYKTGRL